MCLFVYKKEPVPEGAFCAAGLHSVRTNLVLQQLRPEFVVIDVVHAKTGTEFVVIDVLHAKIGILTCSELLPTATLRSFLITDIFRRLLVFSSTRRRNFKKGLCSLHPVTVHQLL